MCGALRVQWTITPEIAPRPWISCRGCGRPKPFQPSGKIRLNANGRKLDAWLIYRCVDCETTWNRPLFERRPVRHIERSVLAALHANDPEWVWAEAFNLDALRRGSQRIDQFPEFGIVKGILSETPGWTRLEIELAVSLPVAARLDRLLASELSISRMRLQALHEHGTLRVSPERSDALRRHVRTGTVVTLECSPEAARERFWRFRATGTEL